MQGLGIGFLDFLDEIDTKVKDKTKVTKEEYQRQFKDYDFNDDAQEVMLDEADIMGPPKEDDEQSGWSGDMQIDQE